MTQYGSHRSPPISGAKCKNENQLSLLTHQSLFTTVRTIKTELAGLISHYKNILKWLVCKIVLEQFCYFITIYCSQFIFHCWRPCSHPIEGIYQSLMVHKPPSTFLYKCLQATNSILALCRRPYYCFSSVAFHPDDFNGQ